VYQNIDHVVIFNLSTYLTFIYLHKLNIKLCEINMFIIIVYNSWNLYEGDTLVKDLVYPYESYKFSFLYKTTYKYMPKGLD